MLDWNDADDFVLSEDTGTSADALLGYVVARIERDGETVVGALIDAPKPPQGEIRRAKKRKRRQ